MIMSDILQWLSPVVHLLGCIIAIQAFRKSHKKGYFLISIYFALALFQLLISPRINTAIAKKKAALVADEKREMMDREISEVYERYYEEEGVLPEPITVNLPLPLGPIILVSGLWLLARKENNSEREVGADLT